MILVLPKRDGMKDFEGNNMAKIIVDNDDKAYNLCNDTMLQVNTPTYEL
jgi:hypothetical protein